MNKYSEYLIMLNEAKIYLIKNLKRVLLFRDLLSKVILFTLRQIFTYFILLENY